MREREKTNKQTNKTRNEETHHKNKNNLRHLASSLFKLKEEKKKTLFIYRSGDRFKKLVMISSTSEYNLKS